MIDVTAIRARRFNVALDCVRGAGAIAMLPLLDRLGCRVQGINLETDGRFPRAPSRCLKTWVSLGDWCGKPARTSGWRSIPTWTGWRWWTRPGRAIGEDYTLAFAVRAVLDGRSTWTVTAHPDRGREPLDQPGRGGCCAERRRSVGSGSGGRGERGPGHTG